MKQYKVKRVIIMSDETEWEIGKIVSMEEGSEFLNLMLKADALEEYKQSITITVKTILESEPDNTQEENKNVRNKRKF